MVRVWTWDKQPRLRQHREERLRTPGSGQRHQRRCARLGTPRWRRAPMNPHFAALSYLNCSPYILRAYIYPPRLAASQQAVRARN